MIGLGKQIRKSDPEKRKQSKSHSLNALGSHFPVSVRGENSSIGKQ